MTHPVPTTFARTAGALLAALALAGCAVGPQYQAPTPAPVKLPAPNRRCSRPTGCNANGGASCRMPGWTR